MTEITHEIEGISQMTLRTFDFDNLKKLDAIPNKPQEESRDGTGTHNTLRG